MRKSIKGIIFSLIFCISLTQVSEFHVSALWNPPTIPTCNAIYLVNSDTGTVIYDKNQNEKIYPASTTKLMTAILVYEKFKDKLNTVVTVERDDITPLEGKFGSLVPLVPGEQLTVQQLLYCMLVKSGDDSADTLARFTAGSIENFADEMNAKAKEIGAVNTHYVNPHGLQDPMQYTTAADTYKIAKYAMQYDVLAKIVATSQYTLNATNKTKAQIFINTDFLIDVGHKTYYYQYVKGIKTGSTTPAGKCLVSYAEKDGKTYYCVAMGGKLDSNGSNTAFLETKSLYQWAFSNFQIKQVVSTTDTAAQVKVDLAAQNKNLLLMPQESINSLVPADYNNSDLKITLHVPASVRAPVKQGQIIGKEDVAIVNPQNKSVQKLGTINLIASKDVALSEPLYILSVISGFFNSIWFKIVAVLLVMLLVFYIVLSVYLNHRRKNYNSRRGKKYRYRHK